MSIFYDETMSLIDGVKYSITNLSNISAYIFEKLDRINWAGFYIMREGKLILGPFQGKTACIEIRVGKGVCGTAVAEDRTMVVPNVHEFKGHIACDSASNSEIVIPLHLNGEIYGVLDIDSTEFDRFGAEEQAMLSDISKALEEKLPEMIA